MSKVLVLGASGSLGRGVLREIGRQHKVTATYGSNKFSEDGVDVKKVDICDPESLDALGGGYETVVLIAGAMPSMMKGYYPQKYIDTNITGALNVLEYCRKYGVKKVIYVMTFSDVSHKFYSGIPIQSDDQRGLTLTGDHAVYAISKVAACDLIEHYHQEYGLQTIIFRIPTIYCADENYNYCVDGSEKVKAYVQMIRSIVSEGRVELWGDPAHAKDMPYIKDFARLIGLAIDNDKAQGVFNAGTGKPVSLEVMVNSMIKVFSPEKNVEKIYLPDKASQPNFTFDMSKTKEAFGYEPEWDIEDMLKDIRNSLGVEAFRR